MDALQWMGAVRMRVQTADNNIPVIHTAPIHQLMSWEDIIVMFLSDSHSDGTHSLQRIHCWDTDAMLHFSKSDEETNLEA